MQRYQSGYKTPVHWGLTLVCRRQGEIRGTSAGNPYLTPVGIADELPSDLFPQKMPKITCQNIFAKLLKMKKKQYCQNSRIMTKFRNFETGLQTLSIIWLSTDYDLIKT